MILLIIWDYVGNTILNYRQTINIMLISFITLNLFTFVSEVDAEFINLLSRFKIIRINLIYLHLFSQLKSKLVCSCRNKYWLYFMIFPHLANLLNWHLLFDKLKFFAIILFKIFFQNYLKFAKANLRTILITWNRN